MSKHTLTTEAPKPGMSLGDLKAFLAILVIADLAAQALHH